jgi:nondiscriminating glutamyl-tRNA synthetase
MEGDSRPRVRFAPSPTGDLHVGNARTALFNWLFARHHGGKFILRIEDTDRLRTSEAHESRIIDDLLWLGLDWDEGPGKGGNHGPYRQSERLDIYARHLDVLIAERKVYPCYCTDEELEAERSRLLARGMPPRYSGRCRGLSGEQKRKLEGEGKRAAWRFAVDEGTIAFDDLIRGPVTFSGSDLGDFIAVRSNGIPAYNFAVVVDDHLMEISHVIRGEDHLSNTAMQILLYRALGFKPPAFAHHALILGRDRSKLSKRHGAVAVREFRGKGVLPEALVNYLALLGSSFGKGTEVLSMDEMVKVFSLDRAGKSGAIFGEEKLEWMNNLYIREYDSLKLAGLLVPYLTDAGYDTEARGGEWLGAVIDTVRGNLRVLSDITDYIDVYYDDRYGMTAEARDILGDEKSREILTVLGEALDDPRCPDENSYAFLMEILRKKTALGGKKLFLPVRAAVTGKTWGPELHRVVDLLGTKSLRWRVRRAMDTVLQK